jgi:hypothetical protein
MMLSIYAHHPAEHDEPRLASLPFSPAADGAPVLAFSTGDPSPAAASGIARRRRQARQLQFVDAKATMVVVTFICSLSSRSPC